jgi:hypothetical protein
MSTTTNVSAPPKTEPARVDDMHDTPEDLARPFLGEKLELCKAVIVPAFDEADGAAIRQQDRHRPLVYFATAFGIAAILFAIVQLALGGGELEGAELGAGALALVAVVCGIWAAFQKKWLLERHKAERLRFAKYRFLIDPDLWCGDAGTAGRRVEDLKAEVKAIQAMTVKGLHRWVEDDPTPAPPGSFEECRHGKEIADAVVDYYRTRRLKHQRDWFAKKAREHHRLSAYTRYLSPVLFFCSVGAVLGHYVYHLWYRPEGLDPVSKWLIVTAAALPVLGGGVRTFRSAFENARNKIRYQAKTVAVTAVDGALDHYPDCRTLHVGLWYSEFILENEHREWLRLMIEAEWFA